MKLLLDECVPRKFRFDLSDHGHEVMTVSDAGFSGKENGELLMLAESQFDALLTVDRIFPNSRISASGEFRSSSFDRTPIGLPTFDSICRRCFLLLPI